MLSENEEKQPPVNDQLSKLGKLARLEDGGPDPIDEKLEASQQEEAKEQAEDVGYSAKEIACGLVSSIDYGLQQFVGVALDDDTKKNAVFVYTPCFEGDSGMAVVGAAGPYLKWVVAIGFTGLTGFGIYKAIKARKQDEKPEAQPSQQPVQQPAQQPVQPVQAGGEPFRSSGE